LIARDVYDVLLSNLNALVISSCSLLEIPISLAMVFQFVVTLVLLLEWSPLLY
jgi:hypothetical protein